MSKLIFDFILQIEINFILVAGLLVCFYNGSHHKSPHLKWMIRFSKKQKQIFARDQAEAGLSLLVVSQSLHHTFQHSFKIKSDHNVKCKFTVKQLKLKIWA